MNTKKKKKSKTPGIEVLKTRTSLSYRASIKINGELIRRTFKKEHEAIEWKQSQRIERDKNKAKGIETKNYIKFDSLYLFFRNSKAGKRSTTLKNYDSIYNKHLYPYLGKKIIRDLTMLDFDIIKLNLVNNNASTHLINKVTTQLKSILKFAVQREFLLVNFMQNQQLIKIDKQSYSYWKPAEIKNFLELIKDDHYYNFYLFAFNTGLRRGEICGLTWDCFDKNDNTLTFGKQRLSDGSTHGLKGHQTRTIPLTPDAVKALNNTKKISDYIFLNMKNKPNNPDNISKNFRKLQKDLKIKKQMKFHGTRHSFASFLASKGVSIQIIQKLLGHVDIKVTQRYSHLTVEDLKIGLKDFKI